MKSLDSIARPIMQPAFERYGFAHAELVAQWAAIVGQDIAEKCSPERLKWPSTRDTAKRHAEGAILVIRADQGEGLALSYEADTITTRINGFFGYQAVTTVKFVQGDRRRPGPVRPRPTTPDADTIKEVAGKTDKIADIGLKGALTRLGQAALSQTSKKP